MGKCDSIREITFAEYESMQKNLRLLILTDYIRKEIPQLKVTEADATYLLWLDCSALGCSAKELADAIRKTTGLYVSEGAQYGKTGEQFLRINLACQRSRIADGCERLKRGVEAYRNQK